LKKADFLVVCELYPEETAEFWRAPGTTSEQMTKINTTVYRLPGAGFAEVVSSFTFTKARHISRGRFAR
jgi:formate dehydrogenase major subunit